MVIDHVLDDFTDIEDNSIIELTENIVESIPILIDKKLNLFSSKVNQS